MRAEDVLSREYAQDRMQIEPGRGVYDARRAAALAGVSMSALHRWAREGTYAPSVGSTGCPRLWSWADLLALRALDWLRRRDGEDVVHGHARHVRAALEAIGARRLSRSQAHSLALLAQDGILHIDHISSPWPRAEHAGKDAQAATVLPLVALYRSRGPDLLVPRPHLRIVPGKLHGEPHVVDTRIPSATLHALYRAGYATDQIAEMFPEAAGEPLAEALDLEASLGGVAA